MTRPRRPWWVLIVVGALLAATAGCDTADQAVGGGAQQISARAAQRAAADIVDTSSAARDRFFVWFRYELEVATDDHGDEATYNAGIVACGWRSSGLTSEHILDLLVSEAGLTRSGAAAILRGAFGGLCPQLAFLTGFRTNFDMKVNEFIDDLAKTPVQLPAGRTEFDYGYFVHETCRAFGDQRIGRAGARAYLAAQAANGHLSLVPGGVDERGLSYLIYYATQAYCAAYNTYLVAPPY